MLLKVTCEQVEEMGMTLKDKMGLQTSCIFVNSEGAGPTKIIATIKTPKGIIETK